MQFLSSLLLLAIVPAVLALAGTLPLAAQEGMPVPHPTERDPQQDQEPLETLKVDVNVVNLFFNVKDRRGALLPGLTRDDFEVFEDGVQQNLRYFSANTEQPLTLGLLLDTSGSQQRTLPMEKQAGGMFLEQVLQQKDLAFIISFDVNVDLLQDFTSSKRQLREALEGARINSGTGGGVPGIGGGPVPIKRPRGTLLYDAVFLAAEDRLAREVGRKAIVMLSDGMDMGSRVNLADAIRAAQKADTIVYVLLVAESAAYMGDSEMKKIAEETGGRMVRVGDRPEKLREAFQQISDELRTQYSIGYSPSNQKRDGGFRKVQIKTKQKDTKVQARKGYYAPSS